MTVGELNIIGAASQAEVVKNGIGQREAEALLVLEVERLQLMLAFRLPWFEGLNQARQAVLVNMAFNLGLGGLLNFKNTLALIETGHYKEAAKAMLNSRWAKQVGQRANELAEQMETGEWKRNLEN